MQPAHRHLGAVLVIGTIGVLASACSSSSSTPPSAHSAKTHPAKTHPARTDVVVGTVSTLSGSKLDLKVRGRAEAIGLTSSTLYLRGHHHLSASAIAPGTRVRVRLAPSSPPTAETVLVLLTSVSGTLVAQSPGQLTLRLAGGTTQTVTTSSSTTYTQGKKTTTASALKVGEHLRVRLAGASSSTARHVQIKAST
ncbi:MAG: DUF5666 domain-containing protein [Actinomycetota bacterium]|jgi:hypothetical protein|nr:DUF5666 domain-containing protein [Actinomycetota bacterium]